VTGVTPGIPLGEPNVETVLLNKASKAEDREDGMGPKRVMSRVDSFSSRQVPLLSNVSVTVSDIMG
jgi:hypothetical protein